MSKLEYSVLQAQSVIRDTDALAILASLLDMGQEEMRWLLLMALLALDAIEMNDVMKPRDRNEQIAHHAIKGMFDMLYMQ